MRICGVGDNVVDRYISLDRMFPGGNALNVAVFARKAGAEAAYLGITGSDASGELVRYALAKEGVATDRARQSEAFNAFSQIGIDEDGNRYFIGSTPPPYRLRLDGDDFDYLAGFDVVHSGDYGQVENQLGEIAAVTRLSFDFGSKPRDYAEPLLAHVDIATFSAPDLADAEVEAMIAWAQMRGPDTVIVTRGAAGAMIGQGDLVHRQAAAPATVRDSLGAGDAFIANILVGLSQGLGIAESGARAARAAAAVCGDYGAFGYSTPLSPLPIVSG